MGNTNNTSPRATNVRFSSFKGKQTVCCQKVEGTKYLQEKEMELSKIVEKSG